MGKKKLNDTSPNVIYQNCQGKWINSFRLFLNRDKLNFLTNSQTHQTNQLALHRQTTKKMKINNRCDEKVYRSRNDIERTEKSFIWSKRKAYSVHCISVPVYSAWMCKYFQIDSAVNTEIFRNNFLLSSISFILLSTLFLPWILLFRIEKFLNAISMNAHDLHTRPHKQEMKTKNGTQMV